MEQLTIDLVRSLGIWGLGFFAVGLVFLVCPKQVGHWNAWASRQLFTDQGMVKHPRVTGLCFLVVAGILFVLRYTKGGM